MPIVYDNWRKMSQIINSNILVAAFDCSFAKVIFSFLGKVLKKILYIMPISWISATIITKSRIGYTIVYHFKLNIRGKRTRSHSWNRRRPRDTNVEIQCWAIFCGLPLRKRVSKILHFPHRRHSQAITYLPTLFLE